MTQSSEPVFAQRRARSLLAAWNSGNLARLESALDANWDADWESTDLQLPAIESERMELVGEVVHTIRGWIASAKGPGELQAALVLLRHVAGQERAHIMREPAQGMALAGSRSI